MEKTSAPVRWWDWVSIAILFVLVQTLASRLVATTWTPFLSLTHTTSFVAFVVGTALGYSRFPRRVSQWLSFTYMVLMLPLLWTLIIDQDTSLEEQFSSVAGRLFFSTSDFFARRLVEDYIFFLVVMTFTFWFIASWAGFTLVRNQNYLGAVVPAAIGMLIIQNYDRGTVSRLWFMAFFALLALLLLGRMHFLQNQKAWRERRVFLSPDNSIELSSSMAIAAGLLIIVSWTIPASLASWDSAVKRWDDLMRPWRDFADSMESAVSALEAPGGSRRGEFFGPELPLGRGFPLSKAVMFEVDVPDLAFNRKPPRYYWRGRTYDYFIGGQWYTTEIERQEYTPTTVNPSQVATLEQPPARFVFHTGDATFSLLYSPSQPIWVSRPGITFMETATTDRGVVAWHAYPSLKAGETYQVDAILANPNLQQLQEAGSEYPAWVTDKYLQLPEAFSPRIKQLAEEITAQAETPYDKVAAITSYLRENIEYAPNIPETPGNKSTLEWILFEHKKAFCVYYATSEVLMLRSIGIPARMAVGFAQGTGTVDREVDFQGSFAPTSYVVRRENAHAWPEVYFPEVGWVEFEPTGNQPALSRPLPPSDLGIQDSANPFSGIRTEDSELPVNEPEAEEGVPEAAVETPLSPWLYIIPVIIAAAALLYFVNRRLPLAQRVPVVVRATFERSGFEVPRWVQNWESWVRLSTIEKAFESINFGLRTLDRAVPMHITPFERAKKLMAILPQMSDQIKVLLDEHQTSLYTSRVADEIQARSAAYNIRKEVVLERIRYLFVGKPQHT